MKKISIKTFFTFATANNKSEKNCEKYLKCSHNIKNR